MSKRKPLQAKDLKPGDRLMNHMGTIWVVTYSGDLGLGLQLVGGSGQRMTIHTPELDSIWQLAFDKPDVEGEVTE